jgi:hypothetical protein
MSRRWRAQMAVLPETLENPERDLDLTTRGPEMTEAPEPEEAPDEEAELRRRLALVSGMEPVTVGCRDCWHHGRDAVLAMIARADGVRAGIEASRAVVPHGSELHWLDCWTQGRDAAIRAIEGE